MSFFGNVNFQRLTNTERSIYGFLHENVNKIPYLGVRDIAREAHAGTSSVMRLIHKMGYESYIDFREDITSKMRLGENHSESAQLLLSDVFPENIESRLRELAEKIVESDNVIFTGVGSSGIISDYAARRLAGVGINTFSFSDLTYPIASKIVNTTNTLIVALSISGETNEIVEALSTLLSNRDLYIVAITPKRSSTVAQLSNFVISYQVTEHRLNTHYDLTSQLPALYISERLTDLVLELSQ